MMVEVVTVKGPQKKVAEEIFNQLRNSGMDVKIELSKVIHRLPGKFYSKRFYEIRFLDGIYGMQRIKIGVIPNEVVLEASGIKSLDKMRRVAGLN